MTGKNRSLPLAERFSPQKKSPGAPMASGNLFRFPLSLKAIVMYLMLISRQQFNRL